MLRLIFLFCFIFTFSNVYGEEEYTIKKGDTLWDISGKFYKDNFKWPIIWKYNTRIDNPDLIFPKNKLAIPIINNGETFSLGSDEKVMKLSSGENFSVNPSESNLEKYAYESQLPFYKVDFERINNLELVMESPPSFRIVSTEASKTYVAVNDTVRIDATSEDIKKGESVFIYTKIKDSKWGTIYKTAGIGEVIETDSQSSLVKITKSFESIQRGFYADKYREYSFPKPSAYREVNSDISGKILYMTNDMRVSGEGYRCIINLGQKDNVKNGDVLEIYRQVKENGYVRNEHIGTIQVIYAGSETATAFIIDSKMEISKGDSVLLHKVAIR